jgi:hypothetical protein
LSPAACDNSALRTMDLLLATIIVIIALSKPRWAAAGK